MIDEFMMVRLIDDEIIMKAGVVGLSKEETKAILQGPRSKMEKLREDYDNYVEESIEMGHYPDEHAEAAAELDKTHEVWARRGEKRDTKAEGGPSMLEPPERAKDRQPLAEGGEFEGIPPEEHIGVAFTLYEDGEYTSREAILEAATQLGKAKTLRQLDRMKSQIEIRFARSNEKFPEETNFIPDDLKTKIENFNIGDSSYKIFGKERYGWEGKAEGGPSMLVLPEMDLEEEEMPLDTYTPDEQAMAEQVPDEEMEDSHLDFILGETLDESEQDYLMNALDADPKLNDIFDKVITTASEFSGEGEVEGPGTGVSDSIPARLSDGEFVVTEQATDEIGADNLQAMMDDAEREADRHGGYTKARLAIGGLLDNPENEDKPSVIGINVKAPEVIDNDDK